MRKILQIVKREYKASVRTKGFIIGIAIAPLLMGGSMIAMLLLENKVDTTDRLIAVIDRSGVVAEALVDAARARNEESVYDAETGKKVKPAYRIEIVAPNGADADAQLLALSDKVRTGAIHAFVEIGPDVVHPRGKGESARIKYYAKNAAIDDTRQWIAFPINTALRRARLAEAKIDLSAAEDMFDWVNADGLGLVTADAETGAIQGARRASEGEAIGIPIAMTMLMFLMMMMGAIPQLQSVMEEKVQRIAEVMLGSTRPFEFMMGKVIGGLCVSLTAAAVYVTLGSLVITSKGWGEYIPYDILPWFFAYTLLGIVMVGAMLAAFGSTCNNATEAQSITLPAMMPIMVPMFILFPVAKEPLSAFSTGMSLVPPFTPFLMLLRQSTPEGVPGWQPWVGLAGMCIFALLSIWMGGRIFRVGILMQGQPPKLGNIVRWAFRG
jgi:ABC-2 type transport system permease protein